MARTGQGEGMAGFCQGARDLCRHKNWWLLATAYGVMTGISSSWSAILSVVSGHDIAGIWVAFFSRCQRYRCRQDLAPVFFDSDAVAAVIGFWGGIAGQVAGVLLSMASDFVGGRKRAMLVVLSGLSVLLITYFTIMCKQHMEAW